MQMYEEMSLLKGMSQNKLATQRQIVWILHHKKEGGSVATLSN